MYFLESERLGLRLLKETDLNGEYVDWFNDAVVCRYNSHHKFPMYRKNVEDFIISLSNDESKIVLAVEEKDTKLHVGNISIQRIDFVSRQAEIAFMFGNVNSWGKGYATEAARLMINHAFSELGLQRLYFGTAENNMGMQRVGEKLGFKKAGTMRRAIYKNGKFLDIYSYDLLVEEWKSV